MYVKCSNISSKQKSDSLLRHKTQTKNVNNQFNRLLTFYKVIRLGFEPKTHSLEGCCSIQLSYRTLYFWRCKISDFLRH